MSSSDIALLQKTTSPLFIELNIKDLQHLSNSEANKIELVGKEELQLLSLEWSENCDVFDVLALEKLQPHQNLRRLCIKNYPIGADFPNWMWSLSNLVSMELLNVKTTGHIHLDHLQNLEDMHVSSLSSLDGRWLNQWEADKPYASSLLHISSTQRLKKLRRVTLARLRKLVWETSKSSRIQQDDDKNILQGEMKRRANSNSWESSCQASENIFPGLEYLEMDCCLDVKFEPSIPKSARYIITGSNKFTPGLFKWPSFKQVMGLSTSASSSKLEIKNSKNISSGPLDSLGQLDIEELIVDSCKDSIPLPECIRGWKSLRKIEILNCEDMETMTKWLGDMASLHELKVETYWMKTLPPCIERLTSLHTLALLKCTKKFKQRCSEEGDDWSKIKHIENLIIEEMKP